MRQNSLLTCFVRPSCKKIQKLLWLSGVSIQNVQNCRFVSIHSIRWRILHMHLWKPEHANKETQTHIYSCIWVNVSTHWHLYACIKRKYKTWCLTVLAKSLFIDHYAKSFTYHIGYTGNKNQGPVSWNILRVKLKILWYGIRVNFSFKEKLQNKFLLSCFVKLAPSSQIYKCLTVSLTVDVMSVRC